MNRSGPNNSSNPTHFVARLNSGVRPQNDFHGRRDGIGKRIATAIPLAPTEGAGSTPAAGANLSIAMRPSPKHYAAFLAHEPLPSVALEHNDYVQVLAGDYAGQSGSIVSVEELGSDPVYL